MVTKLFWDFWSKTILKLGMSFSAMQRQISRSVISFDDFHFDFIGNMASCGPAVSLEVKLVKHTWF